MFSLFFRTSSLVSTDRNKHSVSNPNSKPRPPPLKLSACNSLYSSLPSHAIHTGPGIPCPRPDASSESGKESYIPIKGDSTKSKIALLGANLPILQTPTIPTWIKTIAPTNLMNPGFSRVASFLGFPESVAAAPPKYTTPATSATAEFSRLRTLLGLSTDASDFPGPGFTLPDPADVILVSIDCEAWEGDRGKNRPATVTEIGISLLDTRRIQDVAPGPHGRNWFAYVEYHQIWIEEHRDKVNKFCPGHPEAFNFGNVEVVKEADVPMKVREILTRCDVQASVRAWDYRWREMVLVGHELAEDVKYLSWAGFDILAFLEELRGPSAGIVASPKRYEGKTVAEEALRNTSIPFIDTKDLTTVLGEGLSVGKMICLFGGMDNTNLPRNLHNAGNDAGYTLHSLILMAFRCGERILIPRTRDWPLYILTKKQQEQVQRANRPWIIYQLLDRVDRLKFLARVIFRERNRWDEYRAGTYKCAQIVTQERYLFLRYDIDPPASPRGENDGKKVMTDAQREAKRKSAKRRRDRKKLAAAGTPVEELTKVDAMEVGKEEAIKIEEGPGAGERVDEAVSLE